jgi:hypothetical protein
MAATRALIPASSFIFTLLLLIAVGCSAQSEVSLEVNEEDSAGEDTHLPQSY